MALGTDRDGSRGRTLLPALRGEVRRKRSWDAGKPLRGEYRELASWLLLSLLWNRRLNQLLGGAGWKGRGEVRDRRT